MPVAVMYMARFLFFRFNTLSNPLLLVLIFGSTGFCGPPELRRVWPRAEPHSVVKRLKERPPLENMRDHVLRARKISQIVKRSHLSGEKVKLMSVGLALRDGDVEMSKYRLKCKMESFLIPEHGKYSANQNAIFCCGDVGQKPKWLQLRFGGPDK
jgi:hypothetical protein